MFRYQRQRLLSGVVVGALGWELGGSRDMWHFEVEEAKAVVFLPLQVQVQGRRRPVERLLQVAEVAVDEQPACRSLLSASSALRELTLLAKYTLPGMLPSLATTSDLGQRLMCKH